VRPMDFTGRPMKGMVFVEPGGLHRLPARARAGPRRCREPPTATAIGRTARVSGIPGPRGMTQQRPQPSQRQSLMAGADHEVPSPRRAPQPMRGLEVPQEVAEALGGGKQPTVTITINAHSWRSRVAIMRGRRLGRRLICNRHAHAPVIRRPDSIVDAAPVQAYAPVSRHSRYRQSRRRWQARRLTRS
jgi:hypothetical protein